jgi:hypothetical protein
VTVKFYSPPLVKVALAELPPAIGLTVAWLPCSSAIFQQSMVKALEPPASTAASVSCTDPLADSLPAYLHGEIPSATPGGANVKRIKCWREVVSRAKLHTVLQPHLTILLTT